MLAQSSRILAAASGNVLGRRFASSIALKYSQAAYNAALAKSPQTLTKVHTELASVGQSLKDTPALDAFVNNPLLPAKVRAAGLEAIFKAAAGKNAKEPVSDVTRNLFDVLSENGRLAETQGVIEGFNELIAKYKGELDVIVTSAAPLPKDVLTRLESVLKQSEAAKQAKVVRVSNKVHPSKVCKF
jgi:F-type H+-transporting ATPase subunit O